MKNTTKKKSENNIPKRKKISLDNQTHIYSFEDGTRADISATQLINRFSEPFVPEAILDKLNVDNIVTRAKTKMEWRDSASWGTYLHELCEYYDSGLLTFDDFTEAGEELPPQLINTLRYLKDTKTDEWEVKPEYETYYETKSGKIIGNTIDRVLVNKKDKHLYKIEDHKFTKNLSANAYGKKMLGVINTVPASKINKYSIQLEINRLSILQEDSKAKFVDFGTLLHSSPEKYNPYKKTITEPKFTAIAGRDMSKAVEKMIESFDKGEEVKQEINKNNKKKDICKKTLKI